LLRNYPQLYHKSKWNRWIQAFLDSLFLLFIIVLIQDTVWLMFNTAKWIIPLYSGAATFSNYYVRFPENILGLALFTLLTYGLFRSGVARFNWKTLSYLLIIMCFTEAVFWFAPNQAWTDWTFAAHNGFSDQIILEAFLISDVGYKALIALAFLSLFSSVKVKSNIH